MCCASNDKGSKAAQRAEQGSIHCIGCHTRSKRMASGRSGHPVCWRAGCSSTQLARGCPRPLKTPATKGRHSCSNRLAGWASGHKPQTPCHHPAGTYLRLHLKCCQCAREGLREELLFKMASTPGLLPVNGCMQGWHDHESVARAKAKRASCSAVELEGHRLSSVPCEAGLRARCAQAAYTCKPGERSHRHWGIETARVRAVPRRPQVPFMLLVLLHHDVGKPAIQTR
jgi:hypothetical protein